MFDTGTRQALSINHNYVNLPHRKEVRKGAAGSGQSFMINVNDTISTVKFSNGVTYNNLINVESSNYGWLENKVTPDFLGFIGYDFF
ncbi:hypothetical protein F0L74_23060 [Chitinophaga agrisoli]|uniref:Uncharacterized protein n=1 Tax=Chitinophaga agrisoli TaxID=2607653 RepID=A0A5B2VJT0_9BACT|nr:hypothetical protein [Chitinophaga agrisoli]KAA2239094.1 hypothetical protein F0L74_23060 [Chitinophaga agrisoli]